MGALTLVTAALGAAGSLAAAQAERRSADFASEVAQQQALREKEIAARDAAAHRRTGSRALAAARARRAGSGVTAAGSPLLVEAGLTEEIEAGAQEILAGGQTRAGAAEQRAELARHDARNSRRGAVLSSGRTLLTGLGRTSYGGSGIVI